jgi:HK97 family phage portal protein
MLWGDTFLRHVYNGAGALVGLQPLHPRCVSGRWDSRLPGGKLFTYTDLDGRIWELDARNMTQIMGMTLDGLRGIGIIDRARTSMGAAIAADRAAATMFGKGALFGGLVTPDGDDLDPDDEKKMEELVNRELNGWEHAASLRFINRPLKISPWTQISPEDMQFLESRQFSIQEVARWTGVPANLLMDPGAVSTWGTGVEIQNRGLARFTLTAHTKPMEEAYSRLATPATKFVEFDYAGLERGSPQEEIHLLLDEVEGGVRSKEEYRHVRNMGPADPNDTFAPIGGSAKKKTPTQDQARLPLRAQAHVGHPLDELIGAHR